MRNKERGQGWEPSNAEAAVEEHAGKGHQGSRLLPSSGTGRRVKSQQTPKGGGQAHPPTHPRSQTFHEIVGEFTGHQWA